MDAKFKFTEIFLKATQSPADLELIKNYKSKWWYNLRDKSIGGLRITDECLEFIINEAKIKTYAIDLPQNLTLGPQVLIWLDQFLESPYHLQKKTITVLSEKTAFELYLFSGDIRKMGAAKAMSKRLCQDSSV